MARRFSPLPELIQPSMSLQGMVVFVILIKIIHWFRLHPIQGKITMWQQMAGHPSGGPALRANTSGGRFINPTDYDDDSKKLYCSNGTGNFTRWENPSTLGSTLTTVTVNQFPNILMAQHGMLEYLLTLLIEFILVLVMEPYIVWIMHMLERPELLNLSLI